MRYVLDASVAVAAAHPTEPDAVVERFVAPLIAAPTHIVTIGPRTARRVQRVAMQLKLRAADATCVWLAMREGVPLVTSDAEILRRASAACQVQMP